MLNKLNVPKVAIRKARDHRETSIEVPQRSTLTTNAMVNKMFERRNTMTDGISKV